MEIRPVVKPQLTSRIYMIAYALLISAFAVIWRESDQNILKLTWSIPLVAFTGATIEWADSLSTDFDYLRGIQRARAKFLLWLGVVSLVLCVIVEYVT